MRRHQRFHANLVRLNVIARLTRQNHQLTHHILTGEVDTRIRLGQPLLPGLIDKVGKRHSAIKLQEQPGERAGEDTADRQNAVATFNQVAHGMVNRQTRAYGGVIQPVTAGFFKRVVNLAIFIAAAGPGQFVGADHVETVAGKIEILIGQLFAGGDIQYHQVVIRVSAHPQEQRLFVLLNGFIVKESQRAAGVQPFIAQQAAAAIHHACQHKFKTGSRR